MVFENAQERTEAWYVDRNGDDTEDGSPEQQVSYEHSENVPNCGTVTIYKEDHTIANLLRQQLLTQDEVRFAGYQMPHPLEHKFLLRVEVSHQRGVKALLLPLACASLVSPSSFLR